jgi:hypothetical protein
VLAAVAKLTCTVWVALPPSPEQVIVKDVAAVSAPVLCEPLTGSAPLQPPLAMQLEAFADCQVNMVESPLAMLVSAALSDTLGVGETSRP